MFGNAVSEEKFSESARERIEKRVVSLHRSVSHGLVVCEQAERVLLFRCCSVVVLVTRLS